MSTEYARIIRVLQSGVNNLSTTENLEEFYKTLRMVGAIATHEAKKLKYTMDNEADKI